MNTVKVIKNDNYTTISNVFLRDKNLSIKSKGFLAVIMALKENWVFSINGICSTLKEGKTAVYGIISELKENRYCRVDICRNEKGIIIGNDYTFYEEPYTDEPHKENPNMDNQPQLNTNSNKELNELSTKNKNKKEEAWRIDFNAYLKLIDEAREIILKDEEFKSQCIKFNPNMDFDLTLEKMIVTYWGTETGWKKKKASKGKSINMLSTLKKGFDNRFNIVYKQYQYNKKNKSIDKDVPMPKNYTRVPLHPALSFTDNEGLLNDGTFVKDGYRFYFSKTQGKAIGIPPAADPMPNDGDYDYNLNNGWYQID